MRHKPLSRASSPNSATNGQQTFIRFGQNMPVEAPVSRTQRQQSVICRCERVHHTSYFCSACGGALLPDAIVVLP